MSELSKSILSSIVKDFGDDILVSGHSIKDSNRKVISVTPAIDIPLGGGIPEGSWFTITGKAKVGKSTVAINFAKNWLNTGPKKRVIYGNIEGRLKEKNLNCVSGLDLDRFDVIQSTEQKPLSTQDYCNIFSKILKTEREVLLIVDSFALLSEEAEQVGGVGTQTRGGNQKLLAQFCREIAPVYPRRQHVILGITHQMANTSGFGYNVIEKGGMAIWYQADAKIVATKEEIWEENGKPIGKIVTWHCAESALGKPYGEGRSYHRFGCGIDEIAESIEMGIDLGLISKPAKNSYYTLDFLKTQNEEDEVPKLQGKEATMKAIRENPEWLEKLLEEVRKILQ